jgi:hypothetical protein
VRKAAMLLVEADAQLPSGFPDDEWWMPPRTATCWDGNALCFGLACLPTMIHLISDSHEDRSYRNEQHASRWGICTS